MSAVIRVLLIEQPNTRGSLSSILLQAKELRVAGVVPNLKQTLEAAALKKPDLVLLDCPEAVTEAECVNALTALRRTLPKLRTIVIGEEGSSKLSTVKTLSLGAAAYFAKPKASDLHALGRFGDALREKILSLFPMDKDGNWVAGANRNHNGRLSAVVIGSSTGGPEALAMVLSALPASFPLPILIVQHMLPSFTQSLTSRLATRCKIPMAASKAGALLGPNQVWLAEGGYHLSLQPDDLGVRLVHNTEPPENSCRPAVDVLFRASAQVYGASTLAIVLTGMGQDGLKGSQLIAKTGGEVWIQDEASSVVWGMPGSISQAGIAKRTLPITEIGAQLVRRVVERQLLIA
jgi:two-component system, chemotaxis family, protein-glutamate methylesterase/glutaminase